MELLGNISNLMPRTLSEFLTESDSPDISSGEIRQTGQNTEWKCCMFGSTDEYKNNYIGDLFYLCGSK